MKKRIIAINLPQFHPFKENNEWWGEGFTEWTNVVKARPRFRGHYQPHLPTDTGFYDLRLPEAREMQANMAKKYGIYGFCYYHYWFNGVRLMKRPIDDMLKCKKPDFPFMLCWANENWSRNWDGSFKEVLIQQQYSPDDYEKHMRFLCENVFPDNRYIKVQGKPFFVVYRPSFMPDVKEAVSIWRRIAKSYGFELYLGYMSRTSQNYCKDGFDCCIDFQPHNRYYLKLGIWNQLLDFKNSNFLFRTYNALFRNSKKNKFNLNFNYKDFVQEMCRMKTPEFKLYPSVTPSWDNSARRVGNSYFMLRDSNPELYGIWLSNVLSRFEPFSLEENFVFINAWNEWAEGNHLEPDTKWGRSYLEETLNAIKKFNE